MNRKISTTLVVAMSLLLFGCPSPSGPDGPDDDQDDGGWIPGDVEQLVSIAGDGRIALAWWEPPGSLDHYLVSWTPGGESGEIVTPFDSEHEITGLTNGVEYTVTVNVVVDENAVSEGALTTCTPTAQFLYGGSGADEASGVAAGAGGEYVIAGTTSSDELQDSLNRNGTDVYLVRVGSDGAVAGWSTYGSLNDEKANHIVATTNDGFAIAGEWEVISGDPDKFLALVLDSGLNRDFERALGGSGYDNGFTCLETLDGGFVFAGESFSNDIAGLTYNLNGDGYVVKLDDTGATVWQNMFGGTGWDRILGVAEESDGSMLMAGWSYSSNLPGSSGDGMDDFYLAKIGSDGALQWQKMFGGGWQDNLYDVIAISAGGYAVVGRSTSSDLENLVADDGQGYLAKLDALGEVIWHTRFGGNLCNPATVIEIPGSGYLVVGSGNEPNLGYQGYVAEFDAGGSVVWQCLMGGTGDEHFQDVVEIPGGSYLVVGKSDSSDIPGLSSNGGMDFYAAIVN